MLFRVSEFCRRVPNQFFSLKVFFFLFVLLCLSSQSQKQRRLGVSANSFSITEESKTILWSFVTFTRFAPQLCLEWEQAVQVFTWCHLPGIWPNDSDWNFRSFLFLDILIYILICLQSIKETFGKHVCSFHALFVSTLFSLICFCQTLLLSRRQEINSFFCFCFVKRLWRKMRNRKRHSKVMKDTFTSLDNK